MWVQRILQDRLDSSPTTLEEDMELMGSLGKGDGKESPAAASVLQLKVNHKLLLENAMAHLSSLARAPISEDEVNEAYIKGELSDPPSLADYGLPIDDIEMILASSSDEK
mmetsp:Transcript_39473/g.64254  ORF Transcript_39473/g.64254 Transcript_39473/m.64254 type:complete len:110 (-) Transcript_39473:82-411(-)